MFDALGGCLISCSYESICPTEKYTFVNGGAGVFQKKRKEKWMNGKKGKISEEDSDKSPTMCLASVVLDLFLIADLCFTTEQNFKG